jgi:3-oxoacyl-[acyl-carrier-protein] synthase III
MTSVQSQDPSIKIHIRAASSCSPGEAISSDALEQRIGLQKGWSAYNTGVMSRQWALPGTTVQELGAKVLEEALFQANLRAEDFDLLLFAGASFDHPVPHNACLIKQKLVRSASPPFPCFDIDGTCLSFLHALDIAHLYLQHRGMKRVAIVCVELPSSGLNPADPKTYTLFGDAAVALILEASAQEGYLPSPAYVVNEAAGARLAMVPSGGLQNRGIDPSTPQESFYFQMNGRQLLSMTMRLLDDFVQNHTQQTSWSLPEYDYIIPHQASKIGNEMFMQRYGLREGQVLNTLAERGNCVAASIPLGLVQLWQQGKLQAGTKVLLIGSAAGLSIGALGLRF